MLILGMALALTNYLIDAGIPDAAIDWAGDDRCRTGSSSCWRCACSCSHRGR
jgi:hypothetical protein